MELSSDAVIGSLRRIIATAQNGLEVVRFGGLESGATPSPFQVVVRTPMYRLRRYFPEADTARSGIPIVLVPPMMMAADVYDVTPDAGAVGMLQSLGLDPWVVDFGSPDQEEGGWGRTLTDHIVALDDIIDRVHEYTGRDVHLSGYSQGGMFCYQAAAYRRSRNIASLVTFGSPVDTLAALPFGIPDALAVRSADFLADHVFNRLAISGWMARTGFQFLDPVKTVRSRIDFLMQLHDREALLPREPQRRFLDTEGWVAWSGPAVAELLRQFIAHNRMMSGGFVINDRAVSLAEITCPILAFVGEVDDIGQPLAVRGIRKAAPRADVYEYSLRAGHFGLVVGSVAAQQTWPAVSEWVHWRDGQSDRPVGVVPMETPNPHGEDETGVTIGNRITHTATTIAEVGTELVEGVADIAVGAVRGARELSGEAIRALPRLARLRQLQSHTRVSVGGLLAEQGSKAAQRECFIYDDRVYTYAVVNARIDAIVLGLVSCGIRPAMHVGILMGTRPSAMAAVAAVSRLGGVSVMLAPGPDLAEAIRLGAVEKVITDPENLDRAAATGLPALVLGGGDVRDLDVPPGADVVDLERLDVSAVELPGWYVPNPGLARELAFILFTGSGDALEMKRITNHRWALSAFGTATAAALDRGDTMYCLAPLYHSSGLLVGLGGALAGGARIALSRELDPARFREEIHRYGVTVVTYTWSMLHTVLGSSSWHSDDIHPIRLFLGSGMTPGLWRRTLERFAPARVLEFYASTEGDIVLANVSGAKIGSKGRPLPGSAEVRLAAYDAIAGRLVEGDRGFVRECDSDEVGLLLGRRGHSAESLTAVMRGVFEPGDSWVPTDNLFRRDADGDFWLLDNKRSVIVTPHGPVYAQPVVDVLGSLPRVDLAVSYGVSVGHADIAVAAITLRENRAPTASEITVALDALPVDERPDLVHVVAEIALGPSYRPVTEVLHARGLPAPSVRSWYADPATGAYRRFTKAVWTKWTSGTDRSGPVAR
ncbi:MULTISPECIES: alpha/beta fold hydrolase [unclassified Rhodococcus (in: high G+C Gram-positive bacteria)]|uniref:alpha/beta fold hydrolase n=1 Tax=Rhodococcus sp. SJ-3 TaxID=3454628 RepID=UPI002D929957|nr:alpha/beta fold hydrolase [Rhodococcus sp. (in: high G+C Gram-positive bacteria)]